MRRLLLLTLLFFCFFFAILFVYSKNNKKNFTTEKNTNSYGSFFQSPSSHVQPGLTQDQIQIRILSEILKSKNDNDPRIDTELRILSNASKEAFIKKYEELAPEKRNERGTIVFLIGRNIETEKDINFMAKVLREEPCRSLKNCQEDSREGTAHNEIGLATTLAYPQIVALKSLERVIGDGKNNKLYVMALEEVRAAKHSAQDSVVKVAKELERKLEKY